MINFDFYKVSGQWRLTISEGDCILSTICFGEDVDYQEDYVDEDDQDYDEYDEDEEEYDDSEY